MYATPRTPLSWTTYPRQLARQNGTTCYTGGTHGSNHSSMWCVNAGGYMVFEPIVGSDYHATP